MAAIVAALQDPQFYPQPPAEVRLIQTHISYVFLAGSEVYKLKKPVRFSFLDFSTLERRREFCHEEVRLNRRLAPDVYLGVVSICRSGEGFRLGDADDPEAIEYAVHMRHLDEACRLDRLLDEGRVTDEAMNRIALRLAEFHARAAAGPEITANGSPAAVRAILEDNYENVRRFRGLTVDAADDDAIQAYARHFLGQYDALFRERQAAGCIRECHGDLHADHVYLDDTLVIVDCIEFNTQFRFCDVASDLAFLAMDIEFHGRPELADRLVRRYVEATRDPQILTLLPFYKCYRAYVRGKVDSLKSTEPEVGPDERSAAAAGGRAHFLLAYRYTWSARRALVVVAGLSGSGKSALAESLSARTGFMHVNSDLVRKRLAGISPTTRLGAEERARLYDRTHSARTYAAMSQTAAAELAAGRGVILDATFQRRDDRAAVAALAAEARVPMLLVHCECPDAEIRHRLAARSERGDSPSDADWAVYLEQQKNFEPIDVDEPGTSLAIETAAAGAGALSASVESVLRTVIADSER